MRHAGRVLSLLLEFYHTKRFDAAAAAAAVYFMFGNVLNRFFNSTAAAAAAFSCIATCFSTQLLPPPLLLPLLLFFISFLPFQERGDTVNGGWDPEKDARRTVRLPALTAEQARRREYFYPTTAEVEAKAEKLQERQRKLQDKESKLAKVSWSGFLLKFAAPFFLQGIQAGRGRFGQGFC